MRIWNSHVIVFFGCILLFNLLANASAVGENEKSNDYIYEDDPGYRVPPTSTQSTRTIPTTTTSLAVEVLATIMNLLISDLAEDINDVFRNQTTPAALPSSIIPMTPISTGVPAPSDFRNETEADRNETTVLAITSANFTMTTTARLQTPVFVSMAQTPFGIEKSIMEELSANFTSEPANVTDRPLQTLFSKDHPFLNGNVSDVILEETIFNGTSREGAGNISNSIDSSTSRADKMGIIPGNVTGRELAVSTNLTDVQNSTDELPISPSHTDDNAFTSLPIIGKVGDASSFTANQKQVKVDPTTVNLFGNASGGWNETREFTTRLPFPPVENDTANATQSANITEISEHSIFNGTANTSATGNQSTFSGERIPINLTYGFENLTSAETPASEYVSTTMAVPTTVLIAATTELYDYDIPTSQAKTKQTDNGSCSHRLSETLTASENESIVTMQINLLQKWNKDEEVLMCRFILAKLCRYFEDLYSPVNCAGFKLEIIDEPGVLDDDTLLHLLALKPDGSPVHGKETLKLLEDHQQEMLALLFSNRTNQMYIHPTPPASPPSSHRPYEHPLDNPFIATSLIAVVVTICIVAVLSLLILVLLQRRRRNRKGEWIVNKKDRSTNVGGAHQAYGWCFENDGYASDEKKRAIARLPPVQLLDDRRQRLALPVDSQSSLAFDISGVHHGAHVYPVQPAPRLNSFNGCNNGARPIPPRRQTTSSFNSWAIGDHPVEMEMTEPTRGANGRW